MILRLTIIIAAVGLLSIGGIILSPSPKVLPQNSEQVQIIDGIHYIDIKTPIIIKPSI